MTKLPSGNYVDLSGKFMLTQVQMPAGGWAPGTLLKVWVLAVLGYHNMVQLANEDVLAVQEIAEARVKDTLKG